MLNKVFSNESTWYNRDTDRLECDQPLFYSVTTKTSDNLNMELELGY